MGMKELRARVAANNVRYRERAARLSTTQKTVEFRRHRVDPSAQARRLMIGGGEAQ